MPHLNKYIMVVISLFLCGCSNGPSADEIKLAMQHYADAHALTPGAVVFDEISDVSCNAAQGQPGYICTFSIKGHDNLSGGAVQPFSNNHASVRFVKDGQNWVRVKG